MSTKINILFTGVTGYIGGSVVARFLEHPEIATFSLTTLLRSSEKADELKALGINSVVGSLQDLDLLEKLASKADYIVSLADSDDLESIKALLKGARAYYNRTSFIPTFIHTSGTGAIADRSAPGENTPVEIYNDLDSDQIESIPETALHRDVDTTLVRADKEGYVKTYIVMPSTIYGIASGIFVERKIQKAHSMQVPSLIEASLARGRGGMVGAGKNLWPNVHIDDLSDLYIVLFNSIRLNPDKTGHGRDGLYFGENGEHSLYDVGKAIAEGLVSLGKATNSEPSTFTDEEIGLYFPRYKRFWGSSSRCRANRSRSIGWKPTKTTEDLLASVRPEIEALSSAQSSKL